MDEEVAMDEMLRKDIAELQLAINKNLSIETMQKDDNLQLTSTVSDFLCL